MTLQTRLAVDIGGTFTDLVLALPERTVSAKLLTTPESPDAAVIEGTQAILREAGIRADQLDLVIHGTTLATNALIERKGARTALITTAGGLVVAIPAVIAYNLIGGSIREFAARCDDFSLEMLNAVERQPMASRIAEEVRR